MSVIGGYLVTRKKKPERKEKPSRDEKSATELTTDEAISRLFPKPVIDAVRRDLTSPGKPAKRSIHEE